jgi:molybdopterin-guanine dinucleotide biosynthesis protein MobB
VRTPAPRAVLVSAVGSGRGKTRWVEALAAECVRRGLRVAVVKHHPHGRREEPGREKDTDRARRAGAAVQVLAEPGALTLFVPQRGARALWRRTLSLLAAEGAADVVLGEGFRAVAGAVRVWVGEGTPPPGDRTVVRVTGDEADDPARVRAVCDAVLAAAEPS